MYIEPNGCPGVLINVHYFRSRTAGLVIPGYWLTFTILGQEQDWLSRCID